MSMVQVQADGYLGADRQLHAAVEVEAFVSSASRLGVAEPRANLRGHLPG
jgi:hypothetical protein